MKLYAAAARAIERDFVNYVSKRRGPNRCFGVVSKKLRKDVKDIDDLVNPNNFEANDLNFSGFYRTGNIYVRQLKEEELLEIPPRRFKNSVQIHDTMHRLGSYIPEPLGVLYTGDFKDLALHHSRGYFIATYAPGRTLIHEIKEMSKQERIMLFKEIKLALYNFRDMKIGLLDFAPRDIIIDGTRNKFSIRLVDTEHVEFIYSPRYMSEFAGAKERIKKKQAAQFKKDYKGFLSPEELEAAARYIFDIEGVSPTKDRLEEILV